MKYFYFLIFSVISLAGFSQVTLGTSFTEQYALEDAEVPVHELSVDLSDFEAQKYVNGVRFGPLKIVEGEQVNHSSGSVGEWIDLGNGYELWRMRYQSENAEFLLFLLNDVVLAPDAQIDFYSDTAYLGGINNQIGIQESFLSDKINGESVVIEFIKKTDDVYSQFIVGTVFHGVGKGGPQGDVDLLDINDSANCEYDADCPEGDSVEEQKRSLIQLTYAVGGSVFLCSGAFVNNTAQDGTPYVLSANHCFDGAPLNTNITSSLKINWKATNPGCPTNNSALQNSGSFYTYNSGIKLKADYAQSDVALLELNTAINSTWNVYFAGWDRGSTNPISSKSLHHPSGDVMKVSIENDPSSPVTIVIGGNSVACWSLADWDKGVTEGGSSGSPLFNQNNHIIGQLLGGWSQCSGTGDNGQSDSYGRFNVSWTGGGSSINRLSDWLDPNNTGVITLDGISNLDLGVEDVSISDASFTLYPNPATDKLQLKTDSDIGEYTYEIVNSLGQYIQSVKAQGEEVIDVRNLASGVYFVNLYKNGKNISSQKFIKR